ncbi:MAG: glyoxalase [marine bacterium B5-7]|nr:MAG: glyoxalase [marine bacterium B5-7]
MSSTNSALLDDLIVRPHHTALCIENFDAAQSFFCDVLGMRVENEADQRDEEGLGIVTGLPGAVVRWAMLERNGYRLELFKYYQPEGRTVNIRQCDRGLTHIAFEVSDVDDACWRVRNAGHETYSDPQNLRGGATRPVYVKGPEGIVVELIEFRQ